MFVFVSDDELLGAWISTCTSALPGAELTTAWISRDIWIGGVPKSTKKYLKFFLQNKKNIGVYDHK